MAFLTAGGDDDEFEAIVLVDETGFEIGGAEGLAVKFGDEGFSGEAEGLEEVGEAGGGGEGVVVSVEGHGNSACGFWSAELGSFDGPSGGSVLPGGF